MNKYAQVTGGADVHCRLLAGALESRGHQIAYLATDIEHGIGDPACAVGGVVTHQNRDGLGGRAAARVAATAFWNRTSASATADLIRRFRPEVMHAHKLYPQLSVAPVVVAARLGIPIVQTAHDYEFVAASPTDHTGSKRDREESRASFRALNTSLFAVKRFIHVPRVTRWVAVSRALADVYERRSLIPSVLPNFGIGNSARVPTFDERRGVLFAGRLAEEKGVHHVVALAGLDGGPPVTVAGSGDLEPLVRGAQAECKLRYLGPISNEAVRGEMERARVVVMPSLCEDSGPLTAIEAMISGTPVVAYRSGGLAEYVEDARAGRVVEPGTEALSAAVRALHDNEDLWREHSANGRSAARTTHSPARYVESLEAVYAAAIEGRR
ncbi:MAG TPA: glycosyltransferase [Solirubrobacterales bacterium]|nr:glycosyltransferase [Solirubrobacterales bacterium]